MYRHRLLSALAVAALAFAFIAPAKAELLINVNKSTQQMTVSLDGMTRYVWPVSTGVSGHDTPSGVFKPFRMEADHFSQEWDDAPMPHSIFFTQQGHAIHGSNHTKAMGSPASHGCVRLEPKNAAILFALVQREKMANTRVVLSGEIPMAGAPVARRAPTYQRAYTDNNDYQRSYSNDGDYTGTLPQRRLRTARGYREVETSADGYYYRERPYYPQQQQPQYFPFFGR
jgi:hypothetical protein